MISGTIPRDANRVPLLDPSFGVAVKSTPSAFIGGTTNARGDYDGTSNPTTLFSVTGDVLVRVFGICTVSLAGASATIEVGVAGDTDYLIAQTTATTIDANMAWKDASPTLGGLSSLPAQQALVNGQDIIETLGTANITAGSLYYICIFYPLSPDGDVVAA